MTITNRVGMSRNLTPAEVDGNFKDLNDRLTALAATGIGGAGPMGPAGPAGTAGGTGLAGAAGTAGLTGPAGTTGTAGAIGPAGPQGIAGTAAAKGDPGVAGPMGPAGAAGTAGTIGVTGAAGPTGAAGLLGAPGVPGNPGTAGAAGAPGAAGAAGLPGHAGAYRGDVATEAAMLGTSAAVAGDWVRRTDLSNQIFELRAVPPATLANWVANPMSIDGSIKVPWSLVLPMDGGEKYSDVHMVGGVDAYTVTAGAISSAASYSVRLVAQAGAAQPTFTGLSLLPKSDPMNLTLNRITLLSVAPFGGQPYALLTDTGETYVPTGGGTAPAFTAQSAPNGTVGTPYTAAFTAPTATSYAVGSGALPPSLSLNTTSGTVSGTPTEFSSHTFTINAINASGSTPSTSQTVAIASGANVIATPFFSDTFTGVDGSDLTLHTPDLTPGGGWTVPHGGYVITGNEGHSSVHGTEGAFLLGPASPTDDYQIRMTFNGASDGTGDGPVFRAVDFNNLAYVGINGSPSGAAVMNRIGGVNGSFTGNGPLTSTAPRTMEISAVGPCFAIKINGVWAQAAAVHDVNLKDARKFGFRMAGVVGANSIDNYHVHSIVSGVPFARSFNPVNQNVIWDTDMGNDADDIVAGLVLNALRILGEANILCVTTSTRTVSSVNAIYAINNYRNAASIPIGCASAANWVTNSAQVDSIAASSYGTPGPGLTAPDAITLMRQKLNAAVDGSVVIVTTGFMRNMYDLMVSAANHLGDGIALTGMQLLTAKVKRMCSMLGHFGAPSNGSGILGSVEYNAEADSGATDYVINNWPATIPLYFSGYEIGASGTTNITTALTGMIARPFWDPAAMLLGIRGTSWGGVRYWGLNQGVVCSVRGGTGLVPDPAGNHYIQREFALPSAVLSEITSLCGA